MAGKSSSINENKRYAGTQLLLGMEPLKPILGPWAFDALVEDLKVSGMDLQSNRLTYSLAELHSALELRLGEASRIIMDEIKKALSKKRR